MRDWSRLLKNVRPRLFVCFALLLLTLATTEGAEKLRIRGSDTMLLLGRAWAAQYMQDHEGIAVYAEGGGTRLGVRDLVRGRADICAASRPLQAAEVQQLAARYQSVGFAVVVAKDALSIYIHPKNPVRNFSLAQLRSIFTGHFTNWAQLGGEDRPIRVISRSPNSGTNLYLREHVMEGSDYTDAATTVATTAEVARLVSEDAGAIGYGGQAYARDLVHASVEGVAPTEENVRSDRYPIARYLYLVTAERPQGKVKNFIDWVLGSAGQEIVRNQGYYALWD